MGNIHCAEIARFPQEKFGDIDQHQYGTYKHRISNPTILFKLSLKRWHLVLANQFAT